MRHVTELRITDAECLVGEVDLALVFGKHLCHDTVVYYFQWTSGSLFRTEYVETDLSS